MYRTSNRITTEGVKMTDVVLKNPYILLLLEHFNIEMPLKEKTIKEVCVESKISSELFLIFLNLYKGAEYRPTVPLDFSDILTIVNYLRKSHKYYLEEKYPGILQNIKQMAEVNTKKEMTLVEKFFVNYFNEVTEHLNYENEIVFPYIINLYGLINQEKHEKWQTKYSVKEYKEHHDDIEEKLTDLKNLLLKYLPQKNDQPFRRKLLLSLFELEFDLTIHSKIEDMILIPLVSKMEKHVNKFRE